MNDGPSSSAAAASHSHVPPAETAPSAQEVAERRKKNRLLFNRKRGDLLDDLLRNLDLFIYAELSTLYYLDCSFFRFLVRAFVQFIFLTPKPSFFPEPPHSRPYLGMIVGSNLLCLLLHAVNAAPAAGEATRGYLHGGLAMDFIGQKGPTSKIHLLLLDLLTLVFQLVHLSAHLTRQRLREAPTGTTTSPPAQPTSTAQDLDHEERGLLRADIEMQVLNPDRNESTSADAETFGANENERSALLASTAPRSDAHIFDAFHSGQIVLADIDVIRTIKEQFFTSQSASEQSLEAQRLVRSNLASELLRMRFGNNPASRPERDL